MRILNDDEVLGTIKDPESFFITFNIGRKTMPEENKKVSDELIDVGETTERKKEINLDDKGEPGKRGST